MTLSEHATWQRTTALAKVERDRADFARANTPMSDQQLAARAAAYVDAKAETVLQWMRGA